MRKPFMPLLGAAAIGMAGVLPAAHADTIDFEPAALTGLYLPGDSFVQGAFTLTTRNDFGIIDTAAALGAQSPTGNATQFYFNSNDGWLDVARTDGALFSLASFSAAFVPLDPASTQTTAIVVVATLADASQVTQRWNFASSLTSHYPFSTYTLPFGVVGAYMGAVKSLQFRACSVVGTTACSQPTLNNGQFAIDDIVLGAAMPVPEPAPMALLALGLAVLALRRRAAR